MSKKYHTSPLPGNIVAGSPALITNDLFLASFLHSVGCTLDHIETNGRKRVSFVFTGSRVRELREAYRMGPVQLDIRSFRDSLYTIRRLMDGVITEERSISHVSTPRLQAQPQP